MFLKIILQKYLPVLEKKYSKAFKKLMDAEKLKYQ